MDSSNEARSGKRKDPPADSGDGVGDQGNTTSATGTTTSSSNESNDERRKKKPLTAEKIEERKVANRKAAMESRQRRKALVKELQLSVERLSNEKKELQAMNETMRFQLQAVLAENEQLRLMNAQAFPQGVAMLPAMPQFGAGNLLMGNGTPSIQQQQGIQPTAVSAVQATAVAPSAPETSASVSTAPVDQSLFEAMPMLGLGNMLPFGLLPGVVPLASPFPAPAAAVAHSSATTEEGSNKQQTTTPQGQVFEQPQG